MADKWDEYERYLHDTLDVNGRARNPIQARLHALSSKAMGLFRKADDGRIHLGEEDTFQHFRSISPTELGSGHFTRPIVVTDIETGHLDEPISVAGLKGVIDKRTGEFRVIDTYERYYIPHKPYSASYNVARETHHLTPQKIEALRQKQGATYQETFDKYEQASLLHFMEGSLVVGHNVEEFDFNRLGIASALQQEDILDTLVWAENAGIRKGHRGLSKVFKALTGRTLQQAGYSHHFGFHDVLSNAEVLSAIYRQRTTAGRDARFVVNKHGYSYGAFEPAAGTAIIKGGYYLGRGQHGLEHYMYEDEFDEKGVFEYEYDENGRRVLPEGYHEDDWSSLIDSEEGVGASFSHIFASEASQTFRALKEELERVRESTLGYKVAQKNALIRYLAGKDISLSRQYMQRLGYNEKTIDEMIDAGMPLRWDKERRRSEREQQTDALRRQEAESYISHMYRAGQLTKADYQWLSDVNTGDTGFSPKDIIYQARERSSEYKERQKRVQERRELQEAADFGNWRSAVRDLNEEPEVFDRTDTLKKIRYLDKAERSGWLTKGQRAKLDNMAGSYEDVVEATDKAVESTKRWVEVLRAVADIKPYNINQYIEAARGQWRGITGAAHGVVPSLVLNPISRLGSAAFNAVDRSIAPWNAVQRVWNSGVGNAITGTAWAFGGPVAGGIAGAAVGGLNALSQGIGNYKQAQMEMRGYQIQNTLNTLGALVSWISAPFQLLHKATKLLTGAFSGLTIKLNNIMTGGIGDMSQMGNPLEQLTGVGYPDYLRTTLLDRASLLGTGSTNTSIENMAKMQRDLYRFGKVDTNKLLAASMLGVFNEAFTPTTDAEGAYYGMANKILNNMQGQTPSQQADTLYYATQLDGTLAQTLRSALMLGVTDVRALTNASAFHDMYWRPISAGEESRFRRTQFEYGAATQQFGFSKMRFADMLWNSIGRDLYNGLNRLVDAAAGGNWKKALEEGKGIWETFKEALSTVWKDIGGPEKLGDWKNSIKGMWTTAKEGIWTIARGVIDVWHQIFGVILEKAQGLISYLSTVQVQPTWRNGKLGFNISSVSSAKPTRASNDIARVAPVYDDKGIVVEGMEGYDTLLTAMGVRSIDRRYMTKEGVIRRALNAGAINIPEYGIKDLDLGLHPELFAPLVDYLNIAQQGGPGFWKQAARSFSQIPERYWDEDYLNTTGLIDMYNKAVNEVNEVLDVVGSHLGVDSPEKQKYTIDLTLDGNKAASVTYEQGKGLSVTTAPTSQQFTMKNGYIMAVNQAR